jgi:hypothetical protein
MQLAQIWSRFHSAIRTCAALALASVFLTMAPDAAARDTVTVVRGAATTTVTSLVFNADGTISIESVQTGYLSHVGAFTAHFSYLAVPSPTTIVLVGSGTLTAASGGQLYLSAFIVERGLDYPLMLDGVLAITGGSGRFSGATGALRISGLDEESLTDNVVLAGSIITPRK